MHKEWSFPLVFHQRHHIPNMRGHSGICGLPLADGKHLVRHHAPTAFPLRRATSQAKGWTERPVRMSDRLIEHPSERVGCRTHSSVERASTHQSGWAAGHTAAWSVRRSCFDNASMHDPTIPRSLRPPHAPHSPHGPRMLPSTARVALAGEQRRPCVISRAGDGRLILEPERELMGHAIASRVVGTGASELAAKLVRVDQEVDLPNLAPAFRAANRGLVRAE